MSFPKGLEPEIFPIDNPDERRVILVLPGSEIERIKYSPDEKSSLTKKTGVYLVQNSLEFYEPKSQDFLRKLKEQGLLDAQNILIQNSYNPSSYFKADQIKNDVLKKKWEDYITVCNYLGAESCSILISSQKEYNSQNKISGNIASPLFNFWFKSKSFSAEMYEELLSFQGKFTGNKPNIQAANDYIKKNFLEQDTDFKFLINNRQSALKNGLIEHTTAFTEFEQQINLFTQIENSLDLATNLVIPQYLVGMNAQLNNYVKRIEKFSLKVNLKFSKKTD